MKRKQNRLRGQYYRKIIVFTLVFSFLLFVPFAFVSYRIAYKKINNSIKGTNDFVMSQINYSYDTISQTASNICLDIFWNSNTQQFLYNQEISYSDVHSYLRGLKGTTLQTNPYIDSIVFYNSKRNEWFSTGTDALHQGNELSQFIESRQSIPKLEPILRQVTLTQKGLEIPQYVFSYFMYQFTDPATGSDSYIAVNESAGWFIDTLASIQSTDEITSSTYLINESGIVYSGSVTVPADISQLIVADFLEKRAYSGEATPGYYQQKIDSSRFLISSIQLGSQENYLLIVQNHEEVFRELIALQRDYIIMSSLFVLAIIAMLIPFTKRIYSPIESLVSLVSEDTEDAGIGDENEFELLRNIYQNANELNEKLLLQSETNEPMVEQFQLLDLVHHSSQEAVARFCNTLPQHWLSKEKAPRICVLLIRIDNFENNKHYFGEADAHLLSYAVRNIIHELFEQEYIFSSTRETQQTLCVVAKIPYDQDGEAIYSLIERCQACAKQHLDTTLTVSISGTALGLLNLDSLYQEACEYQQYRFVFGKGHILDTKACQINLGNEQAAYPDILNDELSDAIKKKNISAIQMALDDIKNALHNLQYTNILMSVMSLVNKVIFTLERARDENRPVGISKANELYRKALEAEFIEDFFIELSNYIQSELIGDSSIQFEDRDAQNINAVIDFVQKHYSDTELSSQMIGSSLGLSHRYILQKFNEHTGSSLNEYIASIRMRKAASLLQNTDLPINQITVQIGIENDTYFYKLFKKVYKCTPREFSIKHRKS